MATLVVDMTRRFDRHTLRRLREERDWSETQLAALCGVRDETVRNWERGKNAPKLDAYVLLCEAFGVPLDALLTAEAEE